MADRVLFRRPGVTITRNRALQVGGTTVLLVLGIALPYVMVEHLNNTAELVRHREALFGASRMLGGLDPTFVPSFRPETVPQVKVALNVAAAAPGLQELGSIAALVACWGLVYDEINKFFWWPLHLAAYPLLVGPLLLLVGVRLLRAQDITVAVGPGWVPGFLAGVLVLVVSLRSHHRIDTYAGV